MARSTRYVLHDPGALNLSFYQGYDENFLTNKAVALWFIVNERDHFKEQIGQIEELKQLDLGEKFLSLCGPRSILQKPISLKAFLL